MEPTAGTAAAVSELSNQDRQKVLTLCRKWDTNKDGAINRPELSQALREMFPGTADEEVAGMLEEVDINGDGLVQYEEFIAWLALPNHSKLSYSDHVRSFILPPTSSRGSSASTARVDSPAAHQSTPERSRLPGEVRELLDCFTHPLLARFKSVSVNRAVATGAHIVTVDERMSRGDSELDATLVRNGHNYQISYHLPMIFLSSVSAGIAQTFLELEVSAAAYERIFKLFCQAMADPMVGRLINTLQMPVLQLANQLGSSGMLPIHADISWAAIAWALARLSADMQSQINTADIEFKIDSTVTAEWASVHKAKTAAAAAGKVPTLKNKGRLPPKYGSFDWIRKDNGPEDRFHRVQAFLLSQRAVWGEGFLVDDRTGHSSVKLRSVQSMVDGTEKHSIISGEAAPRPTGKETRVLLPREAGLRHEGGTVMEVASALAAQGKKVAAVSAASAYKRGGGASTGGRHALEESWCIMSTLFESLVNVPAEPTRFDHVAQHIPTLGCVFSPDVEIFREPTAQGYGFLTEPVKLAAVISVAMFNRNPGVRDSPLDSPFEPAAYISESKQKFEVLFLAAIKHGIEDLVIPDAGCGVFQNDPLVMGACLGSVVRKYTGHIRQVVICGNDPQFAEACQRVFNGKDPRDVCPEGDRCRKIADKVHMARLKHTTSGDTLDATLVKLVENPEERAKPECRYGASCHIQTPEHRARFSHPEPEFCEPCSFPGDFKVPRIPSTDGDTGIPRPGDNPDFGLPARGDNPDFGLPARGDNPDFSGTGTGLGRTSSAPSSGPGARPVCKYGEKCFNKTPQHLAAFAHPWLDGAESLADAQMRRNNQAAHSFLDNAKNQEWQQARDAIRRHPDLINLRPEPRRFALLHYACFQAHISEIEWLITHGKADPKQLTNDGFTPARIFEEALSNLPVKPPSEKERTQKLRDQQTLTWLKRLAAGENILLSEVPLEGPAPIARTPSAATSSSASGTSSAISSPTYVSPVAKPSRAIIMQVIRSQNPQLDGEYVKLSDHFNGLPVFSKTDASSPGGRLYLLFSKVFTYTSAHYGWVIHDRLEDGTGLAYMLTSSGDPSKPAFGQYWSTKSRGTFAYHQRDPSMKVELKPAAVMHF